MSSLCYFELSFVLLCDPSSFCCTKFHKVEHKVSQRFLCDSLYLLSACPVTKRIAGFYAFPLRTLRLNKKCLFRFRLGSFIKQHSSIYSKNPKFYTLNPKIVAKIRQKILNPIIPIYSLPALIFLFRFTPLDTEFSIYIIMMYVLIHDKSSLCFILSYLTNGVNLNLFCI